MAGIPLTWREYNILTYFFATIIFSRNPTFVPSLSEIINLSCITSFLVLPGFLVFFSHSCSALQEVLESTLTGGCTNLHYIRLMPSCRMSNILTHVWVALVTTCTGTDKQRIKYQKLMRSTWRIKNKAKP